MRGIIPRDFVAWVTKEKGLRVVELAKALGVSMRYDRGLKSIRIICADWPDIIVTKRSEGALRSLQKDLKGFWKAWRERNPGERQFVVHRKPKPRVERERPISQNA